MLTFRRVGLIGAALIATPCFALCSPQSHPAYDPSTKPPDKEASQSPPHKSFRQWVSHDAAGFFTLVLCVVGGVQIVLFYWQLRLIRQSLTDAKIAADAAKDGAKAAQDSADIARTSMVAGDRAYVHYSGCRWISHPHVPTERIFWRIRPRWINSGNTPTRELRVYVHYEFFDEELPDDYAFIPDPTIAAFPATIAPKGMIESGSRDFFGDQLAAAAAGKNHLYIWGIARYRDVFPGTPERITKFCVVADNITGNPLEMWNEKTNIFDIAFRGHHRHNCADEDCA